ncbi:MAG TPA: Ig-like domain-containing protein [Acidimicrobiales bacterium]|nr:Ig-like domain-containing protein [Acidimicrobiales bacterium]
MRRARGAGGVWRGVALGSALLLVGCSAAGSQQTAPPTTVPPVTVASNPAAGARGVPLAQRLAVSVTHGTLASITLTSKGGTVEAVLPPAATSWASAQPLTPTTLYTVRAGLVDEAGRSSTQQWHFSTGAPSTVFRATISPGDGAVMGVGMPVVVTTNVAIPETRRAAFERLLTVSATPAVNGAWHWFSPTELHWRPAQYWAPGTRVAVAAHIDQYDAGGGAWGVKDVTVAYRIGDSHISTVDVASHTMTVTDNGKVIKVIPVSTGRDKYPTKGGVHVVSDKSQSVIMDSATVGIPRNSPDGYYETVYWDVRISNSGEFVHAAPWSVGDQGHVNVSHGCVNVSTADAEWFYDYSQVGDVVTVLNSPVQLEPTNGIGDWQIPWAQWAD